MNSSLRFLFCSLLGTFLSLVIKAQPAPESFGYRHLTCTYQKDQVDILIRSKKGEEQLRKPVLLFIQGSMPQPLLKYEARGAYGVFPFAPDSILQEYHLAIIGKPGIPLAADVSTLSPQMMYLEQGTGNFPKEYQLKASPEYYVARNKQVINFLLRQPWVNGKRLVVAGHSEGAGIAAKLAAESGKVTHLIYSSGNPLGRLSSIMEGMRQEGSDSAVYVQEVVQWWQQVVQEPESVSQPVGDTYWATYQFGEPHLPWLLGLKKPALVTYGSKDPSAPGLDHLHFEVIRNRSKYFTFQRYYGLDHNFFPIGKDGLPDHSQFNWDKIASDWLAWLRKN